jgi:hypothetical protein
MTNYSPNPNAYPLAPESTHPHAVLMHQIGWYAIALSADMVPGQDAAANVYLSQARGHLDEFDYPFDYPMRYRDYLVPLDGKEYFINFHSISNHWAGVTQCPGIEVSVHEEKDLNPSHFCVFDNTPHGFVALESRSWHIDFIRTKYPDKLYKASIPNAPHWWVSGSHLDVTDLLDQMPTAYDRQRKKQLIERIIDASTPAHPLPMYKDRYDAELRADTMAASRIHEYLQDILHQFSVVTGIQSYADWVRDNPTPDQSLWTPAR